ncbi:hypothetical protein LZF95_25040 [Algoriphagus sp. AGSA1]|uniref:hypothetical protein n=1 Tax=Algoriphagus sp. AGSA1 TaxID=2907213 RepID=UPI001F4197D4|nr:hypothetical protein [Algoriphagus sp. AGSA1]MCE7057975.1 hypothetical protein [Algoriphagus sp. AGSA1]
MMIGVALLTAIALVIAITRAIKKSNRTLSILSILITIPSLLYCGWVFMRSVLIYTEPEPKYFSDRIENNRTSIVLEGKTIHLTGFKVGSDYKRRRVYISGIPYFNSEFKIEDAYFCQGDSTFELFYAASKDSVVVFIPKAEPMYHDARSENLLKVPVRAIQLTDSEMAELKSNRADSIKRFNWEKDRIYLDRRTP